MAIDETKRFTFVSQGLPEDTFSVVTFKGTEGISRLYEYDITLASDDPKDGSFKNSFDGGKK